MDEKTTFGAWVRTHRKSLGLTQAELAQRIPCSTAAIRKIEADQRRPSAQIAQRLAESLGIPPQHHADWVSAARSPTQTITHTLYEAMRPPAHLPVTLTALLGRESELAAIRQHLLGGTRLLTLIGPPGVGKTILSLHAAAAVRDHFADGVFFAALAPIRDKEWVAAAIARVLGLGDDSTLPPAKHLEYALQDQHLLLVLDNFEQVIDAAPLVSDLLATCPFLSVLTTSRVALRLRGERRYLIAPLPLPVLGQVSLQTVSESPAVKLFVDRAQAVSPDFQLSERNASAVAALCQRLDGLPLAIELIAARTRLLEPQALLDRLDSRLILETDGLRDGPDRLRTLDAAIGWSYDLLPPDEQRLFARLGIFWGGFSLDAAEAICGEGLPFSVLDGLQSLLDKSLIYRYDTDTGARGGMLETIREYAISKLRASDEWDVLHVEHARCFLSIAEIAGREIFSPKELEWLDQIEDDLENYRAALRWSLHGDMRQPEIGLRLCRALARFWRVRGFNQEGRQWLMQAIDAAPSTPTDALALAGALYEAGELYNQAQDYGTGKKLLEEGLQLYQRFEDEFGISNCMRRLGYIAHVQGDYEQAYALYQRALEIAREIGEPYQIGASLYLLGMHANRVRDVYHARQYIDECLLHYRTIGYRSGICYALQHLALLVADDGGFDSAIAHLEEALAIARELRHQSAIGQSLSLLAEVLMRDGQFDRAKAHLLESLENARRERSWMGLIYTMERLGGVASGQGDAQHAARLFGAGQALRDSINFPVAPSEAAYYQPRIDAARTILGDATFEAAWHEGQQMTVDDLIDYMLSERANR